MNISSSPRSWIRAASLAFLAAGVALVVVGVTRYDLPGSVRPTQFAPAPRPLPARLMAARCDTRPAVNSLVLPALCVTASIVHVGDVRGLITVPPDVHVVGWYAGSARTDSTTGSTVIVGHVNYAGQGPGAFSSLTKVKSGERVGVNISGQGTTYWKIVSLKLYPKLHLTANLFTLNGPRYLTLITCGGTLQHTSTGTS